MQIKLTIKYLVAVIITISSFNTYSGDRFKSSYPCRDTGKTCVSKGIRSVAGEDVYRDCWEWSYEKTCDYPSRNDCSKYGHCYLVALRDCLLKDSIGYCVNQLKEYSCKRWVPTVKDSRTVKIDLEERDGEDGLVCEGIPCLDGNCVDKSYMTNGEMMDSVSKLYMVSHGKPDGDKNICIFKGDPWHCTKKMAQHTNCCSTEMGGWGTNLGANCTKDERTLLGLRHKNLCKYVGKKGKTTIGVTTLVKHHWCCYESVLSRIIQEQGRAQLYAKGLMTFEEKEFGTPDKPDCSGFTIEQLEKINFHDLDLREFVEEFKAKFYGQYKAPNIADIEARVKGTLPDIRRYDGDPNNHENNLTGWSGKVKDDSYEALEERLFEEEKRRAEEERVRLASAEEARQRRIREEEEKARRKVVKEQELVRVRQEFTEINRQYQDLTSKLSREGKFNLPGGSDSSNPYRYPWRTEYDRVQDRNNAGREKKDQLEKDLRNGNY